MCRCIAQLPDQAECELCKGSVRGQLAPPPNEGLPRRLQILGRFTVLHVAGA